MNKRTGLSVLGIYLLMVLITACSTKKDEHYPSPPGYDLSNPHVLKLPLELDEISGVSFYPKDTSVFAIQDENGLLYKIYLNRPGNIEKWKFSGGADFEDVVLYDSVFYVLQSTGDIIAFKFVSPDSMLQKHNVFPEGSGSEFEILYHDPKLSSLVMICKDCEMDKKKALSTFAFRLDSLSYAASPFTINVKVIAEMLGKKKIRFKPSAAAINPVTGELYIVSAINKLLVIADAQGNATKAYELNPRFFKQPEGICFSPKGDLIISNEAADVGVANILIYPYKQIAKR